MFPGMADRDASPEQDDGLNDERDERQADFDANHVGNAPANKESQRLDGLMPD